MKLKMLISLLTISIISLVSANNTNIFFNQTNQIIIYNITIELPANTTGSNDHYFVVTTNKTEEEFEKLLLNSLDTVDTDLTCKNGTKKKKMKIGKKNVTKTILPLTVSRDELIDEMDEDEEDEETPLDDYIKVNSTRFLEKSINMNEDTFSYAYTLIAFIIVVILAILGMDMMFGGDKGKKEKDYLLYDEERNDLVLQYK